MAIVSSIISTLTWPIHRMRNVAITTNVAVGAFLIYRSTRPTPRPIVAEVIDPGALQLAQDYAILEHLDLEPLGCDHVTFGTVNDALTRATDPQIICAHATDPQWLGQLLDATDRLCFALIDHLSTGDTEARKQAMRELRAEAEVALPKLARAMHPTLQPCRYTPHLSIHKKLTETLAFLNPEAVPPPLQLAQEWRGVFAEDTDSPHGYFLTAALWPLKQAGKETIVGIAQGLISTIMGYVPLEPEAESARPLISRTASLALDILGDHLESPAFNIVWRHKDGLIDWTGATRWGLRADLLQHIHATGAQNQILNAYGRAIRRLYNEPLPEQDLLIYIIDLITYELTHLVDDDVGGVGQEEA